MDDWSPLLDDKTANVQSFADPLDSGPRGEESTCPKCRGRALRQEVDFPAACLRQVRWLCKHGCTPTVQTEERDPPKKAPVRLVLAPRPKPRPVVRAVPDRDARAAVTEIIDKALALIREAWGSLSIAELARRCGMTDGSIYAYLKGRRPGLHYAKQIIAALSGLERGPKVPVISPEAKKKFQSLPYGSKSAEIARKAGLPEGTVSGIFAGLQASPERLSVVYKALDEVVALEADKIPVPLEIKRRWAALALPIKDLVYVVNAGAADRREFLGAPMLSKHLALEGAVNISRERLESLEKALAELEKRPKKAAKKAEPLPEKTEADLVEGLAPKLEPPFRDSARASLKEAIAKADHFAQSDKMDEKPAESGSDKIQMFDCPRCRFVSFDGENVCGRCGPEHIVDVNEMVAERAPEEVFQDLRSEIERIDGTKVSTLPVAIGGRSLVSDGGNWHEAPDVFDLARELARAAKHLAEIKGRMHELPGGRELVQAVCQMESGAS